MEQHGSTYRKTFLTGRRGLMLCLLANMVSEVDNMISKGGMAPSLRKRLGILYINCRGNASCSGDEVSSRQTLILCGH